MTDEVQIEDIEVQKTDEGEDVVVSKPVVVDPNKKQGGKYCKFYRIVSQ